MDSNDAQRAIQLASLDEPEAVLISWQLKQLWLEELILARGFKTEEPCTCDMCGKLTSSPKMILKPYRELAIHNATLACPFCEEAYWLGKRLPKSSPPREWSEKFPTRPPARRFDELQRELLLVSKVSALAEDAGQNNQTG